MLFYCYTKKIIIAAILATVIAATGHGFADDDETPSNPNANSGQPEVIIDEKKQRTSGIRTMAINLVQHQAEYEAIGKVISIQPLLALRERYLSAQAELKGAQARQKLAALHLKRQQELFKSGIAPKRLLQDQEAQGIGDQAAVAVAQAKLSAISNEAQLNWGNTLAHWALAPKAGKLADFTFGRKHLLQITLPTNKQLTDSKRDILIEPTGNHAKALPATWVSNAVLVDNTRQGQSYFFQTDSTELTIGMKVTAWISDPEAEQNGVMIPESALIWYLDQAYVYIKTAKDTFSRRALQSFNAVASGYLVSAGLAPGDEIVLTGGQMLLSEELKQQIPDED